jgi:hypothetical protein
VSVDTYVETWSEMEDEIILEAFIIGGHDIQWLQAMIAKSLCRCYDMGRTGRLPEYAV